MMARRGEFLPNNYLPFTVSFSPGLSGTTIPVAVECRVSSVKCQVGAAGGFDI